jgi:hypothetical protein
MSYVATAWRWAASTFGPQKQVPFNDDQQYPDCGPSIRVYTLENILYGLEKVMTPLLEQLATNAPTAANETSGAYATDSTPTEIGSAACKVVTVYNLSTAAAPITITINAGEELPLEAGYSMTINVVNLNKIEAYQAGNEGDVIYFKYQ